MAQEPADTTLWCLHCQGPDDVSAAPDRATAMRWAAAYTLWWLAKNPSPHVYDPVISQVVAPWPWSADAHAASLVKDAASHEAFANKWLPADWQERLGVSTTPLRAIGDL